ncbi:PIG-L family deacetylase [Streptomyces sp. NBC_00237]|uniref:PIG-L family deacetylase n=1 Tax=Streptomyces sp. NBC_00237 TaxID=2975687 RepID=UPI00225B72DB|nr:PIG-L family deacetylase [Streptomyces sp. NBC_00237]MCX5204837.1 PIG-L family deacetylase [Streptomyces sp. NBC_00237]
MHSGTGPTLPRRTLLAAASAGTAALGIAAAACTVPQSPRRRAPVADPAPGQPIAHAGRSLLLQFLAHPDDDLYFMNPDSRRLLEAGTPVVSVYVTAGEANGINHAPGHPRPAPDKSAYVSARQQGLRQAYATLLGLEKFAPWQRTVLELRGGKRAELNTLVNGDLRAELVFLNVSVNSSRARAALTALWSDRGMRQHTLVADNSPVRKASSYDYEELVDALAGLLDLYRPTVVQTLDPDPDIQHSPERVRRKDSEQAGYSDHPDHTAVACFSWAALNRWVAEKAGRGEGLPRFTTTAFRGYYNRHWPKNLPQSVLRKKAEPLVVYGGDPDWECGNPAGCGDYSVGKGLPLKNWKGWVRSTNYRYPGPQLVAHEERGTLVAYGVLGLRLVRWQAAGRGWGQPKDLGGGPLAPVLGQAMTKDGKQLLFGLRFAALEGHGGPNLREIVQYDGLLWSSLGSPERQPDRSRRIGVPVAVTAGDGRVHLFVRNAAKSVSTRVRGTDGWWDAWRVLEGPDGDGMGDGDGVQDGLSAVVDGQGLVHLFAAARKSVRHWAQPSPGARVALRPPTAMPAPGDVPRAFPSADGSLGVVYRAPHSPALVAVRPDGTPLTGLAFEGYGPVAAGAGGVLLGRDERGEVRLRDGAGRFTKPPEACVGTPVLVRAGGKGTAVAGLGADATPWLWRA